MPIYVYECEECRFRFQRLQGFNDPPPEVCPNCGKQGSIHRIMAPTSFVLKGSGWYATDYKDSGDKKVKTEKPSETKKAVSKG